MLDSFAVDDRVLGACMAAPSGFAVVCTIMVAEVVLCCCNLSATVDTAVFFSKQEAVLKRCAIGRLHPPRSSALNPIQGGAINRCNVGCQHFKATHCGITASTKKRLQHGPALI